MSNLQCVISLLVLEKLSWFEKALTLWYSHISFYVEIKIKELEKRASGQAFELILSPPSTDAAPELSISSPKKKECSLEEIQRKLEAAEERRKVSFVFHAGFLITVVKFSVSTDTRN